MRLAIVALVTLLVTGCMRFTAVRPMSTIPGVVRVSFEKQTGNVFVFVVLNYSAGTMVVDRNAITLKQIGGERARLPGGAGSLYAIPPGGMHRVNLRFPLEGLHRGDPLWFHWQSAIQIAGAQIPVEPIELHVD